MLCLDCIPSRTYGVSPVVEPITLVLMRIVAAECQPAHNERGHVVRYKFAFQWCEGQVSYHLTSYFLLFRLLDYRVSPGGFLRRKRTWVSIPFAYQSIFRPSEA